MGSEFIDVVAESTAEFVVNQLPVPELRVKFTIEDIRFIA
jgi:hypothetical protein